MKITKNKGTRSTAIGIILAWVCILAWAFYKEFETKMIILFIVMFITSGVIPVFNLLTSKEKSCLKK